MLCVMVTVWPSHVIRSVGPTGCLLAVVLQYITEHFAADISTLVAGGYDDWMQQPMAAVAGIVLADQFTR